jgi:acetylornithine deacetylase/succinyl-diaminopimelate desuccinylase-like protein
VHLNEVTRGYFLRTADLASGQEAADRRAVAKDPPDEAAAARLSKAPYENALLHNTCIATMLSGGHADNALPQTAVATVNCRLLPGENHADVEGGLKAAVGPGIEVTVKIRGGANPSSPLNPTLMGRVDKVVKSMWPNLPVVPVMETGGTDAKPLRGAGIPTYGVSLMFSDIDDIRAHGKDERIRTSYFYEGVEFGYRMMKAVQER